MSGFFTRERFGRPQFLAGLLLLVFLGQCAWLAKAYLRPTPGLDLDEEFRIQEGLRQWRGQGIAGTPHSALRTSELGNPTAEVEQGANGGYDPHHSPLYYLIASAPLLLWPARLSADTISSWGWLARAPYLLFGVLLGASLWYVSRRLYGNAGGYVALVLYCFSSGVIWNVSGWLVQPQTGAAWGTFGAIFTAIAVAHTLYAPREVVLWNWRRMMLLGLSFALAGGSQFSLILVVPVVLPFMLYLAPTRRAAALAIWTSACGLALALLFASYHFHPHVFWEGLRHAWFLPIDWRAFGMRETYESALSQIARSSPALAVALPAALITYVAWRRTRYFGNTAPLLIGILFLAFDVGTSQYYGLGFHLMALPFLFVFVAGVSADLLETRHRQLVLVCLVGLLAAYAIWNVTQLAMVRLVLIRPDAL